MGTNFGVNLTFAPFYRVTAVTPGNGMTEHWCVFLQQPYGSASTLLVNLLGCNQNDWATKALRDIP